MQSLRRNLLAFAWLVILILPACTTMPSAVESNVIDDAHRISELNREIIALDGRIDPHEARLAATIAIRYSRELAQQYEISGSAISHNLKVNLGLRERGLCIHWTEDLLARLQREKFHSLDLHWAIANYESAFRLEHSTVIVTARNTSLYHGLVLDPWRKSGELFWSPTLEDEHYPWRPKAEIMALKRDLKAAAQDRRVLR